MKSVLKAVIVIFKADTEQCISDSYAPRGMLSPSVS